MPFDKKPIYFDLWPYASVGECIPYDLLARTKLNF